MTKNNRQMILSKYIPPTLSLLLSFLVSSFYSCTTLPTAGGVETGNPTGVVMGKILDTLGSPAPNTQVTLFLHDYDPIADPASEAPTPPIDTTNNQGLFTFDSVDSGSYRIEAVQLYERTRLITPTIQVASDSVEADTDTLKATHRLLVMLPDSIDTTNGYIYIPGTGFYKQLTTDNGLWTNDQGQTTIILDSIPVQDVDVVLYTSSDVTSQPDSVLFDAVALRPPYSPSPVIKGVSFDTTTLYRAAAGSDIWFTTWADDDHLYSAWGNGGGFGGSNTDGRTALGVARLEGDASALQGYNVFGGKNPESSASVFSGKPGGMLSVDGTLYMSVIRESSWNAAKICQSADHGSTWTCTDWDFESPFHYVAFLNVGQNYQGARDSFVYVYSRDDTVDIFLARVSKNLILTRTAYEFFMGADTAGNPLWTSDISQRKPVFTDSNGIDWGIAVSYNPGIQRYLLTTARCGDGSWGLFDASAPWGPWTTAGYYYQWIDSLPKHTFLFPIKWISVDGLNLWMVFSGDGDWDSYNHLKARLELK